VKPSLSQKSFALALVTRLPVQACASSCAITFTSERSPARSEGVTKVSPGFSMPPYGKLGGITRMSNRSHSYGPNSSSAARSILLDLAELLGRGVRDRRPPRPRAGGEPARGEVAHREPSR